ncbi:MAG: DUF6377 domain-containing protein [Candidatus Azobacteroides sp.]|nr:DUF6377 domain-containing protein [Candidatus Azobacteroides sp.]
MKEREQLISDIKKMFQVSDLSEKQAYILNSQLYEAYNSYQSDSAVCYLEKNLLIAQKLNNTEYLYQTKMNLSFLYWLKGKFLESLSIVGSLDRNQFNSLPQDLLITYYEAYKRFYYYYADSQGDAIMDYYQKSSCYRDSLLSILPVDSTYYKVLLAEKLTDENQIAEAKQILLDLLDHSSEETHERAIIANILANTYKKEGNREMQKKYYAISSISDIKNAVKENASMQALALLLYEEQDIDNAYKCIQSSMDDAIFCNARFRTFEITKIFPIIDSAYQEKAAKQKNELKLYLLLVSILSLFLVIAILFVSRQMKRIAKIRQELFDTNAKLNELNTDLKNSNTQLHHLNDELTDVNRKLSETNLVKETYLVKFIDLCSSYIEKLDNYRRNLNKIASSGKLDELFAALKSSKFIEEELLGFYTNFDETFLRVYPSFIEAFNALFPEEERPTLKQGELLNTELRIYALIRLGINDSSKIAVFLRCSITTVYTYRSKLKNKSLFKESFEEQVMKIGTYD